MGVIRRLRIGLLVGQSQRKIARVTQQANGKWNNERRLLRLARRGRAGLLHVQGILLAVSIVLIAHNQFRRTRLGVPVTELPQVDTTGVFHRNHKILAGNRLPVMTIKV